MFNINTFSTNNGHHSVQLPVLSSWAYVTLFTWSNGEVDINKMEISMVQQLVLVTH